MIYTEVPKQKRELAIKQGVKIMNTFNKLVNTAVEYTEFDDKDYIVIADIYREARQELARFFDYLPQESQDRFYNYAKDVREYEEKITAEDGIERMKLGILVKHIRGTTLHGAYSRHTEKKKQKKPGGGR